MFSTTFKISPYTKFDMILRSACSYWGLIKENFGVFHFLEGDGEPIDVTHEETRIFRFLENLVSTTFDMTEENCAEFYIGRPSSQEQDVS